MKNNQEFQVDGFIFTDETSYQKALQEAAGIRYIRQKTDMSDPEAVYELYLQLLEWNQFESPIGMLYLHELREYLCAIPFYKKEEIPPIPALCHTVELEQNKTAPGKGQDKLKNQKKIPYAWKRIDKMERRYHISMVWNLILVILVTSMLILTMTSDNANILNYRTVIINQYENWEKSLDQKEKELKKREEKIKQQEELQGNSLETEEK